MADDAPGRTPEARGQDLEWARYSDLLRSSQATPFDRQWARYREIFASRKPDDGPPVVWRPGRDAAVRSNLARFMAEVGVASYADLHRWSVRDRAGFWEAVIRRLGIVFDTWPEVVLDMTGSVEDPRWLPGARMNIVDSCFTAAGDRVAVVCGREDSEELERTSYGELRQLVLQAATGLRRMGFGEGDRIALFMPMDLECVVAYLAVVAIGASVVSVADSLPPWWPAS